MHLSVEIHEECDDMELAKILLPVQATFWDLEQYIGRIFGWEDHSEFYFRLDCLDSPISYPDKPGTYDATIVFLIPYQIQVIQYQHGSWNLSISIELLVFDETTPQILSLYPFMLPEHESWTELQHDMEVKKNKIQLKRTVIGKYRKNSIKDAQNRISSYRPNVRNPAVITMEKYDCIAAPCLMETTNDLYYDVYHRCVLELESGRVDNLSIDALMDEPDRYVLFKGAKDTFLKEPLDLEELAEMLVDEGRISEDGREILPAVFREGPIAFLRYLIDSDLLDDFFEYLYGLDENSMFDSIGIGGAYMDLDGAFYHDYCKLCTGMKNGKPFFEEYEKTYVEYVGNAMISDLDKELYMDMSNGKMCAVDPATDALYEEVKKDPFRFIGLRYPVAESDLRDSLIWRLSIPLGENLKSETDRIGSRVCEMIGERTPISEIMAGKDII